MATMAIPREATPTTAQLEDMLHAKVLATTSSVVAYNQETMTTGGRWWVDVETDRGPVRLSRHLAARRRHTHHTVV